MGCLRLEGDCTIGRIRELHGLIVEALARDESLALDVGAVTHADIAFVQLVASASRTFEARGLSGGLVGASDGLRTTFHRAGLDIDGAGRLSILEG